jgi:hypothetical protein
MCHYIEIIMPLHYKYCAITLQLLCHYVAIIMQLHMQQCADVAIMWNKSSKDMWQIWNIWIFNILIHFISIIQLKAEKMLTHGI